MSRSHAAAATPVAWRFKPDQALIVLGVTAALFGVIGALLPGFLALGNIFTLARSVSVLGVLGLGMAVVVIGRGIDLSQVAALAVSSAIAVALINAGLPMAAALLAGLAVAVAIGVLNGFLVSFVEIPPLFATFATALVALGVTRALVIPHYQVFLEPGHELFLSLGGPVLGGLPFPVVIFAILALVLHLFLSRTVPGRLIYAHGDNPGAARLTGISVRALSMLEYAICSAIGYLGGLMMVASTALMHLQVAESTLIFDVILVVVLGGVSLVGGRGGVGGVVAGTLLIGVLLNAMTILNLDVQTQNMIKGAVLLVAITLDSVIHPRDEETAKQGD